MNSTLHICTSGLHNINEDKTKSNQISKNKIIPLIKKLTHLKNVLFHHILFLFKFIKSMAMDNIK